MVSSYIYHFLVGIFTSSKHVGLVALAWLGSLVKLLGGEKKRITSEQLLLTVPGGEVVAGPRLEDALGEVANTCASAPLSLAKAHFQTITGRKPSNPACPVCHVP